MIMELSKFYPSPADLIAGEVSVLQYVMGSRYINERHSQFAQDAKNSFGKYRGQTAGLFFHSFIDVWHVPMHRGAVRRGSHERPQPNARLSLGASISARGDTFANVTYCLAVCRVRPRGLTILRKFHFDVIGEGDGSAGRRQRQPRCHLQYCGKMVPSMRDFGCRESQLEQMHPWLSEPRIPFWPMSLALLMDMALREFPDQESAKFREDSHWRGIVRAHETLLLKPFFNSCIDIIADAQDESRTLADAFYLA